MGPMRFLCAKSLVVLTACDAEFIEYVIAITLYILRKVDFCKIIRKALTGIRTQVARIRISSDNQLHYESLHDFII